MHKHTLQSYAKINLFLEVIKKLKNGYHDLSSIITRISISDKIKIDTAADFSVKFIGPFCSQVSQESNIHTLFQFLLDNNFINHSNYAILIDKQIPVGSGLGGGSSNVAEILKYLLSEGALSKSQCLLAAKELCSYIEFFLEENSLVINEFAPRVHNSGHWTQNGCTVDQFEQHIRAITGWKLGNAERHSDIIMENLIGDEIYKTNQLVADGSLALHLYGKADVKPGRKMGHFNRIKN